MGKGTQKAGALISLPLALSFFCGGFFTGKGTHKAEGVSAGVGVWSQISRNRGVEASVDELGSISLYSAQRIEAESSGQSMATFWF
ncbi:uncharacterized protein LOC116252064 isoform X2 [Nymphaea colorata]|uniref:uncharacterized protein LOC116252064 isoform X2 n=1 Tax=Nymphaea colorata TaxID=210225 RepID=UPI00214EBFD4|nr:uncharacterized protein LOC116252064 isoform X2 [Nymphaea colorata]